MGEFKIPKHRVPAQVRLVGGGERAVEFFLADSSGSHAGPEQIADLLQDDGQFVPAFEPATSRLLILHKRQILTVAVAPPIASVPALELNIPTAYEVALELADGQALRGVVACIRPPERSRLVDLLNTPERFLRLVAQDRVLYVNKAHLTLVTERDVNG